MRQGLKTKIYTLFTVLPIVVLASVALAADGTGAGNGDNSNRDAYLAKLKRELGPQIVVGAQTKADTLSAWCSRVSAILKRESRRARLQLQYDHLELANQILNDALVAAGNSMVVDPTLGGPMTKTLIDRGLMMSQALDQVGQISQLNFLFEYVDFVVRIESAFDRPMYVDYRYGHGDCYRRCSPDFNEDCYQGCAPQFRFADFQRQFIQYAREQLQFVTGQFTDVVVTDGAPERVPVGSPMAFLKIAELVSGFVASDLRGNLYAYTYACVVRDLEVLTEDLQAYNLGFDRSVYPNDRWAVASVADQFERLSGAMASCRY